MTIETPTHSVLLFDTLSHIRNNIIIINLYVVITYLYHNNNMYRYERLADVCWRVRFLENRHARREIVRGTTRYHNYIVQILLSIRVRTKPDIGFYLLIFM